MVQKTAQKSLLDLLVRLMPEWGNEITFIRTRSPVNQKAAKTLFSIWLDAKNRVSERKFKRPDAVSMSEIEVMEREGLVSYKGSEIEVTAKGVNIIKTMLLGDERSSWEDDGTVLDYTTAAANIIPKRVKTGKKAGTKRGSAESQSPSNWYQALKWQ